MVTTVPSEMSVAATTTGTRFQPVRTSASFFFIAEHDDEAGEEAQQHRERRAASGGRRSGALAWRGGRRLAGAARAPPARACGAASSGGGSRSYLSPESERSSASTSLVARPTCPRGSRHSSRRASSRRAEAQRLRAASPCRGGGSRARCPARGRCARQSPGRSCPRPAAWPASRRRPRAAPAAPPAPCARRARPRRRGAAWPISSGSSSCRGWSRRCRAARARASCISQARKAWSSSSVGSFCIAMTKTSWVRSFASVTVTRATTMACTMPQKWP